MKFSIQRTLSLLALMLAFGIAFLKAQEPILGEIRMFAGNFAPRGWAFCDGQLLPISTNSALFSLLGTTYGGDGKVTFGLPDLRGRVPVHTGQSKSSAMYPQGQMGGSDQIVLQTSNLPAHTAAVPSIPFGNADQMAAVSPGNKAVLTVEGTPKANINSQYIGTGLPVNNMQPYTVVRFIIALEGVYPSR
jgi:microcystin-dependent protein